MFLASAVGSVAPEAERCAVRIRALALFDASRLYELSSMASALFWLAPERRVLGEVRGSVQMLLREVAAAW